MLSDGIYDADFVRKRKNISPATSDKSYSLDEIEFSSAIDRYKRINCRKFPMNSEILEIIMCLGYRKTEPAIPLPGEKK